MAPLNPLRVAGRHLPVIGSTSVVDSGYLAR